MKITVLHYIEITAATQLGDIATSEEAYITNEGGKQYIVEVWS